MKLTNTNEKINAIEKDETVRIGGYSIDLSVYPWLKDHTFHNVTVLPGSFLIDLACRISQELYFRTPYSISNLIFLNPLILKSDGIKLGISISRINTFKRKLLFSETEHNLSFDTLKNLSAETELNLQSNNTNVSTINFSPSDFIKTADEIDVGSFYSNLYDKGNHYGNEFRNLDKIWRKNNSAAAQLKNKPAGPGEKTHLLHPALLDSAIQILSLLTNNTTGAFVLDSIKEVQIINKEQNDLWCYAEIISDKGDQSLVEGDVSIFNSSGNLCLLLSGVKIKYPEQIHKEPETKKKIILAANFTIDPLEDSLRFWNNFFNSPFNYEFAPYNQVFQELLDPSGRFHENKHGINIILLNPEEWLDNRQKALLPVVTGKKYLSLTQNKSTYLFPNKMEIVHLNKYETDYLYDEIFRDKCYQKHGIIIKDNDTVIDIGANIGLFTLYVNVQSPDVRVFSFEPSPVVFDLLKTNVELYCRNTKVFNKGVSDKNAKAAFTFYPNSSVFSGFAADQDEDTEIIRQVIENILRDESGADEAVINNYLNEITGERLKKETYECELTTVSEIIRENNLDEINLLKIDAEKSELQILQGIDEDDWQKIKQIVIEIHDTNGGRLQKAMDILTHRGFHIDIDKEKKLRKAGMFNLYAKRKEEGLISSAEQVNIKDTALNQNIRQFSEVLLSFTSQSPSSVILGILPASSKILSDKKTNGIIKEAEQNLIDNLSASGNINIISSNEITSAFNIRNYYDETGKELGNIPYTSEMYASIGTILFRKSFSLISTGCKAIILDCDNTLWKGLCGEDGYEGIQLTENYKSLQKFLLGQFNSGKLLCMCSKNNKEDIDNVFENRNDMILKQEDFISSRINWNSKSENVKSLISEFDLSPDSFVFIDDNPVECAEVKSNCKDVITLTLPQNEDDIPAFLKNTWIFDTARITEEDKKRTNYYRSNILRNKYYEAVPLLKDFIDGLNLKITVTEADESRLDRAAQLTFRTNQFNFTTIRRNESELRALLHKGNYQCLLTEVSDRFGDYGITGVLIYSSDGKKIMVDTFLLSCRVLGKGVEHKILSELGKRCLKNNVRDIEIKYIQTNKNKPALNFINTLIPISRKENNGAIILTFTPGYLSELKYEPDGKINMISDSVKSPDDMTTSTNNQFISSEKFQTIAELSDINVLMKKISGFISDTGQRENKIIIPPGTNIEKELSGIWQRILDTKNISINDNFFDCGGTSLKAIQLIAEIKKEMKKEISIIDLFECPTINKLAEKLSVPDKSNSLDFPLEIRDKVTQRRRAFHIRKRIE